eukprot:2508121-Rhodomonas_salina.1
MEALSVQYPDRSVWQYRAARVAHVIKAQDSTVFLSLAATVQGWLTPTTDVNMIIESSTLNCMAWQPEIDFWSMMTERQQCNHPHEVLFDPSWVAPSCGTRGGTARSTTTVFAIVKALCDTPNTEHLASTPNTEYPATAANQIEMTQCSERVAFRIRKAVQEEKNAHFHNLLHTMLCCVRQSPEAGSLASVRGVAYSRRAWT